MVLASGAGAQSPGTQTPSPTATTSPNDLLAGPPVVEDLGTTQPPRDFSGEYRRWRKAGVSHQRWFYQVLRLDLSEDVASKVRAIREEFDATANSFRESHGKRLAELQRMMREVSARDEAPSSAVVEELRELRSRMPRVEDSQRRVWDLLTPAQQAELVKRFEVPPPQKVPVATRIADPSGAAAAAPQPNLLVVDPEGNVLRREAPPEGPDVFGDRRLAFLRARQSTNRAGAGPGEEDRTFDFKESGDRSMDE
jgi:hypothetical protein